LLGDNTEASDTSIAEPEVDEQSDWGSVEVEDNEWSDEELMDDARPGRRRPTQNSDPKPCIIGKIRLKNCGGMCQVYNGAKDRNVSQKQWVFDENTQKIIEKPEETPTTSMQKEEEAEFHNQQQN
jgi:hypothetical protein